MCSRAYSRRCSMGSVMNGAYTAGAIGYTDSGTVAISRTAPSPVSLDLAELTSAHLDVRGFFRDLAERLKVYVPFDFVKIVLYDPATNRMRVEVAEGPIADRVTRGDLPLTSASGWTWQQQEPLVIPDTDAFENEALPQLKPALRRCG